MRKIGRSTSRKIITQEMTQDYDRSGWKKTDGCARVFQDRDEDIKIHVENSPLYVHSGLARVADKRKFVK